MEKVLSRPLGHEAHLGWEGEPKGPRSTHQRAVGGRSTIPGCRWVLAHPSALVWRGTRLVRDKRNVFGASHCMPHVEATVSPSKLKHAVEKHLYFLESRLSSNETQQARQLLQILGCGNLHAHLWPRLPSGSLRSSQHDTKRLTASPPRGIQGS